PSLPQLYSLSLHDALPIWSGRRGTSRRKGRGTVGRLSWELERASSAPGLRPGKQGLPITGGAGKWRVAERQSEGVVVVLRGGTRSEEHTSELQSLRHLVCR